MALLYSPEKINGLGSATAASVSDGLGGVSVQVLLKPGLALWLISCFCAGLFSCFFPTTTFFGGATGAGSTFLAAFFFLGVKAGFP